MPFLRPVEGLKDVLPFFFPDTTPPVFYTDPDLFFLNTEPHGRVMIIRIFTGVGYDIFDGGKKQLFIAKNQEFFFRLGQPVEFKRNGEQIAGLGDLPGQPKQDLVDADQVDLKPCGRPGSPGKPQQRLGPACPQLPCGSW